MPTDREESLRRLSHIVDIHIFDESNPGHATLWKKAESWRGMWDLKTPQVQEMTENWLAWIIGETDEIKAPSGV